MNKSLAAVDAAAPVIPTDETKVPHYFGPNPNWALSPLTLPDVVVTIAPPPGGTGRQATAQATVGANGAVTGITIVDPGTGYTSPPTVAITGAGTGATADAVVTLTGIVTAIKVDTPGAGYTAPVVTIGSVTSGGATTQATATAYGGVDHVAVSDGGLGYTMPVVDFDFPDDPNGTIAKAHALMDANGTITEVIVDDPGSGYAAAPNIVIRDGPIYAPVNNRQLNAGYAAREMVTADKKTGPLSPAEVAAIGPAASTNVTATATLKILYVTVDTFGADYTSAPDVLITENPLKGGTGAGAMATAAINAGGVTGITNLVGGSGYITSGGIKKFTDPLPDLCDPSVAGSCSAAKYIPLGVPTAKNYNGIVSDEYEIGLVQYRTNFSSSLPNTLVRGYVQLDPGCTVGGGTGSFPGSQCFPLTNELLNGSLVPITHTVGTVVSQRYGVTPPQWLGPTLAVTKDKPVRIIFRNLLPTGSNGNLFIPVDTTLMGSGMGPTGMWAPAENGTVLDEVRNPLCTQVDPLTGKLTMCFKDDRATLHLHGGITPWISDGTPHQWITPASENTPWPQGVSVGNVPDMAAAGCDAADDGCMTFYYTNQQSARLQFYHDHAYGVTRLNVMAGEAAGYVISDETEKRLTTDPDGVGPLLSTIPGAADTKALVIQDRTFVPQDKQLYNVDVNGKLPWEAGYDPAQIASYGQDPTWDKSRWGGYGNIWNHHVYMPAQNPGDPSGMSAYGRWMYGPWFWPPAANTVYGPIANPYYNKDPKTGFTTDLAKPCDLNDPTTWQYQTDPFCEPQLIPGTPNISVGMEQFNDTPIVNGVAYPTITLEPKTYRFRMLNAANDRFFNFQWYVGDPSTASTGKNIAGQEIGATEVALNPNELAAAQTDPNIFPTPDTTVSLPGPDWVQIGNEGGFLPAPAVIDGQQFTTWITDPTRFDVGNVDKHSLLLAPAERADVIVDFSKFAGQTLILYNDGPAAFPARVASYDYYTGAPDLSPNGAPGVLPGYGPNTRTVMQVKIAANPAAPAFNLTALNTVFSHKANLTGVFESGQHPIIVGQAGYNSAYGKSFVAGSDCSTALSGDAKSCDGLVRVSDTASFNFNTLKAPTTVMNLPLQPKAIHDEMNSTTFDDYGRMQATLGMEAQPPSPGVQNATLYPYVNPGTELIDATNLPKNVVTYDINGLPVSDVKITPISNASDGTQIWRITHNGVDTHPIHFHLFDVQVLNRVTWDNIIIQNDANELGWKETLRVSPLEDTIVALRPIIPQLPWELPNAIRNLNPAMPTGSTAAFNNVDPQGNPTAPIVNELVNFGWEYVYHCHILSHEEMDMMRPVSVAMPPNTPDGLTARLYQVNGNTGNVFLSWNDNSISETGYAIEKLVSGIWTQIGTINSPLNVVNTKGGQLSYTDKSNIDIRQSYQYRVMALNTVGGVSTGGFPTMTAKSAYTAPATTVLSPTPPTNLSATLQAGPRVRLAWTDNANNETGYVVERSVNGGAFSILANLSANTTTYTDATVTLDNTYAYRVAATGSVQSPYSNIVTAYVALPAAPTNLQALPVLINNNNQRVTLTWVDNATNETGFTIQWSSTANFTTIAGTLNPGANATTALTGNIARQVWYFRIRANNAIGSSSWTTTGGIQPAAMKEAPKSPLVFVNSHDLGLYGWTGQVGTLQPSMAAAMGDNGWTGLEASWSADDPEDSNLGAYVFHPIGEALGSYMANFYFNPLSAVIASPVDIFTGLDATGEKIFAVQLQMVPGSPNIYQVRGWAKTELSDVYTDWVTISNAGQNIQLDWQSDVVSSLNLYVQEEMVASVGGDTSLYKLVEERFGPSTVTGEDAFSLSPTAGTTTTPQTVYLDEFISLSTQITQPYTPFVIEELYIPLVTNP